MKHDLTTGTWKDDTGCPISIVLAATSDVVCESYRLKYLAAKPTMIMTKKAMMTNNKWTCRFDGMRHASLPLTDKHCQYCLYQYTHELDDEQRKVCGKMLKNREHVRQC